MFSLASWLLTEAGRTVGVRAEGSYTEVLLPKGFCPHLVDVLFAVQKQNLYEAVFMNCLQFSKKMKVTSSLPTVLTPYLPY